MQTLIVKQEEVVRGLYYDLKQQNRGVGAVYFFEISPGQQAQGTNKPPMSSCTFRKWRVGGFGETMIAG